jgi:hypothetical protein
LVTHDLLIIFSFLIISYFSTAIAFPTFNKNDRPLIITKNDRILQLTKNDRTHPHKNDRTFQPTKTIAFNLTNKRSPLIITKNDRIQPHHQTISLTISL